MDLVFRDSKEAVVSEAAVPRLLLMALANNTVNLSVIPDSVQTMEKISVSLCLILSYTSVLDTKSSSYKWISTKLYKWLEAVFYELVMTQSMQSNMTLWNEDGWVGVLVEFHYNTRFLISSDVLTAAVLKSRSPFLYLKHTLSVNGVEAQVDYFNLSMTITSLTFTEDLSERGSDLFLVYSSYIRVSVRKLYEDIEGFIDIYVTNMTAGSVAVKMAVDFQKGRISLPSVLQVLKLGLSQLEMDGLTVDPDSLNLEHPTLAPAEEMPLPGYADALIVICGLAVVLIPVVTYVGLKTAVWRRLKGSPFNSQTYTVADTPSGVSTSYTGVII
nr:uncharacterized protein LOC111843069 [Paramormyrops kingsleyae]